MWASYEDRRDSCACALSTQVRSGELVGPIENDVEPGQIQVVFPDHQEATVRAHVVVSQDARAVGRVLPFEEERR